MSIYLPLALIITGTYHQTSPHVYSVLLSLFSWCALWSPWMFLLTPSAGMAGPPIPGQPSGYVFFFKTLMGSTPCSLTPLTVDLPLHQAWSHWQLYSTKWPALDQWKLQCFHTTPARAPCQNWWANKIPESVRWGLSTVGKADGPATDKTEIAWQVGGWGQGRLQ